MSAKAENLLRTRTMATPDLATVLRIEQASYDFPWSERVFADCLRVGYRCFAATDAQDQVLGYALLSIVLDESHILNLCVDPAYRRQGIAQLLLDRMLLEAGEAGVRTMLLEVRPSNKGARKLYATYGFKRIAVRPGYYPAAAGREDAYLLSRRVQRLGRA